MRIACVVVDCLAKIAQNSDDKYIIFFLFIEENICHLLNLCGLLEL